MADVYDRILEIAVTADESDDTVAVTAVTFYRDRSFLDASDGETVPFSGGTAAATAEIELGSQGWTPNVIRVASTFQA